MTGRATQPSRIAFARRRLEIRQFNANRLRPIDIRRRIGLFPKRALGSIGRKFGHWLKALWHGRVIQDFCSMESSRQYRCASQSSTNLTNASSLTPAHVPRLADISPSISRTTDKYSTSVVICRMVMLYTLTKRERTTERFRTECCFTFLGLEI